MKKRVSITIDSNVDDFVTVLAKNNGISKSELVNEVLKLYANNMLSDPLKEIEKKLNNIESKLEKELNRYNSILAKDALYSIAGRQHIVALHSLLRNKEEAVSIAEKTWNIAISRLKEKEK